MKKFTEKKIQNESASDLHLVTFENTVEDANGVRKEPDSVGLVIENIYADIDDNSAQFEFTKQQAIDLAADLLQAAFADRYDLSERRPFFDEAGTFEPVFIGKRPEDSALLGFTFAPNIEVMKKMHLLGGESAPSFIVSREDALRLIRLMLNQIKESIKD